MKKLLLFILLPFLFISCKEEIYSTIPNTEVYVRLDLSFEDMILRDNPLAYKTFSSSSLASSRLGYGGILVVCGIGIPSPLYAYDLACPVEVKRTVKVVPDDEGYCTCPKCGSKFNTAIGDGRPVSGPAREAKDPLYLRNYPVSNTGNNIYLVTNSRY